LRIERLLIGAVMALAPAWSGCEGRRPPSGAGAWFRDATEESGLEFLHDNGAEGEYHLPEIMGSGCALLDYDGDGDLDVFAIQGVAIGARAGGARPPPKRQRLFRNRLRDAGGARGALRFEDATAEAGLDGAGCGMGCAVGDIDNDGDPDLYVTRFGANVLYENEGGVFRDVTAAAGAGDPGFGAGAAFLDYDRDGDLDLYVANYAEYSVLAVRECTRLGGRRDYCGPLSYEAAPDVLYRNEGGGRFADASAAAGIDRRDGFGLGVVAADFDGDGWVDIFVANDASPNFLWINLRNGRFEDRALLSGAAVDANGRNEACMGVAAGDFDRDGDLDVLVTNEVGETNTLYRNLGGGFFEDASDAAGLGAPSLPDVGFGAAWMDADLDGWLDLLVVNGSVRRLADQEGEPHPYRQPSRLYRSAGGAFRQLDAAASGALAAPLVSRALAIGDVDDDGDLDALVTANAGPLRLLLNESPRAGRWLRVRLAGTRSPRDGTGSLVELHLPDGARLLGRAATDGSYLSASDGRVSFGLGRAERVRAVVVRWTSGRVESWGESAVDLELRLVEGEGRPLEGG
jgi:hypothetical protein